MPRAFIQRNMNTDDITLTVNAIQIFLLYTGNVKRLLAIAQDVHMKGITIRRNLFSYISESNDSDRFFRKLCSLVLQFSFIPVSH